MSEKDSKKLYPVSDKDIKAMRDQLENGTNSYSKINQSIISRFKQEQEKEDRNREIEKMKERSKDLLPASDKDIQKMKEISKEENLLKEGEEEGEGYKGTPDMYPDYEEDKKGKK
jgi:hypothetical protein